jgi:hypothetical protein
VYSRKPTAHVAGQTPPYCSIDPTSAARGERAPMASEDLEEELEALVAIFGDAVSLTRAEGGSCVVETEVLHADDAEGIAVNCKLQLDLPVHFSRQATPDPSPDRPRTRRCSRRSPSWSPGG